MIFVFTSCLKNKNIEEILDIYLTNDIKNIELSGVTKFAKSLLKKLRFYQENYNVNFSIHNYFSPPKKNIVLNLATSVKKKSNFRGLQSN